MTSEKGKKILFINAGATVTGVPVFFIKLISWLKVNTGFNISILTAFGGPLESEYHKLAPTYRWDGTNKLTGLEKYYPGRLLLRILHKIFRIREKPYQVKLISKLKSERFDMIYVNSVASLPIFEEIRKHIKIKTILHVHELQMSILQFCGEETLKRNIPYCSRLIVISKAVESNLKKQFGVPENLMSHVYTFIDNKKTEKVVPGKSKEIIRNQLGIPQDAFVVASSGTTDWRKGADLVVHIAKRVNSGTNDKVHFIWIGGDDSGLEFQKLKYDLLLLNLDKSVHFLGIKETPLQYFATADVFMLCSREEPVGIVALEASSLGKPILCFDQAGGMPEFVEDDCGYVLPYLDLDAMADHIVRLKNDKQLLQRLGERASNKVKRHDINIACSEIVKIMDKVLES